MSWVEIGVAAFKSVCPGKVRRMRAESAIVTVVSVPASRDKISVFPLVDFTVPATLAAGACAKPQELSIKNNTATAIESRTIRGNVPGLLVARRINSAEQLNHVRRTCGRKELSNGGKSSSSAALPSRAAGGNQRLHLSIGSFHGSD